VNRWLRGLGLVGGILLSLAVGARADLVELLSGIRVSGTVVSLSGDDVVIDAAMGGGKARMTFALAKVHAITVDGERRVIHEKAHSSSEPTAAETPKGELDTPATPTKTGRATRSPADVDALIKKAGETPPEWWDSVPLEYPKSLDLSWPEKPPGGWDANRNVGQYLFSVINENPGKWKSGVRFLHHLLTLYKDDPQKLARATGALGEKYFSLLDDPARAAFWYRKSEAISPLGLHGVLRLAECYWKLGSKSMAVRELGKVQRYIAPGMVKLWAEMGDLRKALSIADELAETRLALAGHMAAGDACRYHGRHDLALRYYGKVLAVPATGKDKNHVEKVHERARNSVEAVKVFDALDLARIPDGTYSGDSLSYAGPLQVAVTIAKGRIEEVKVTRYQDKQYFGALTDTPKQIVEKQGVKGVDAITGATITSQAVINATAKALASGLK